MQKIIIDIIVTILKPSCDLIDAKHHTNIKMILTWRKLVMASPAKKCLGLIFTIQFSDQNIEKTTGEE
ncbi:MAG: hypothetical protein ABIQ02_15130 [Saprospiraceae bacterium]